MGPVLTTLALWVPLLVLAWIWMGPAGARMRGRAGWLAAARATFAEELDALLPSSGTGLTHSGTVDGVAIRVVDVPPAVPDRAGILAAVGIVLAWVGLVLIPSRVSWASASPFGVDGLPLVAYAFFSALAIVSWTATGRAEQAVARVTIRGRGMPGTVRSRAHLGAEDPRGGQGATADPIVDGRFVLEGASEQLVAWCAPGPRAALRRLAAEEVDLLVVHGRLNVAFAVLAPDVARGRLGEVVSACAVLDGASDDLEPDVLAREADGPVAALALARFATVDAGRLRGVAMARLEEAGVDPLDRAALARVLRSAPRADALRGHALLRLVDIGGLEALRLLREAEAGWPGTLVEAPWRGRSVRRSTTSSATWGPWRRGRCRCRNLASKASSRWPRRPPASCRPRGRGRTRAIRHPERPPLLALTLLPRTVSLAGRHDHRRDLTALDVNPNPPQIASTMSAIP